MSYKCCHLLKLPKQLSNALGNLLIVEALGSLEVWEVLESPGKS